MSPLYRRFKSRLGILPKVQSPVEVFEELKEVVFSLNHIALNCRTLTVKHYEDLRVARNLLTITAIEIGALGRENGAKL